MMLILYAFRRHADGANDIDADCLPTFIIARYVERVDIRPPPPITTAIRHHHAFIDYQSRLRCPDAAQHHYHRHC